MLFKDRKERALNELRNLPVIRAEDDNKLYPFNGGDGQKVEVVNDVSFTLTREWIDLYASNLVLRMKGPVRKQNIIAEEFNKLLGEPSRHIRGYWDQPGVIYWSASVLDPTQKKRRGKRQ